MKLIECYIENFGKLSEVNYKFTDGFNAILKENGHGKTTLSVFIKAMLYGLDATKKLKLEENDRKHYTPWQGGRFGGTLTYEAGGRTYRVERTFMPKASDDTLTIYDLQTGKSIPTPDGILGEELFGIDADGFERTVFLSEANLSGKNDNKTVSAKLSDLAGVDGDLSVMDEATELLEKQRKIYRKRGGAGEIGEIQKKISAIENELIELSKLREELEKDELSLKEIKSKLEELYEKRNALREEAKKREQLKLRKTYERQYEKMMESLREEEAQKALLEKFFSHGIPEQTEITAARIKMQKAQSIRNDALIGAPSGEYASLLEFFKNAPGEEEFEKARTYGDRIKSTNALLLKAREEKRGSSELPKIEVCEKNANKSCAFAMFFAIAAVILAFVSFLFFIPLIALCAVSAVASFLFLSKYAQNKNLLMKLQIAAKENERKEILISELEEQLDAISTDACNFISHFPIEKSEDVSTDIAQILRKYDLFMALREREGESEKNRLEALKEAEKMKEEAEKFLAHFPTASENPFDEIMAKLLEYNTSVRTVKIIKANIDEFLREHDIDPEKISEATDDAADTLQGDSITALEEQIRRAEDEKVLIERAAFTKSSRLEAVALLLTEKEDLISTQEAYEEKLDTIQKTASYLMEAKELLTSKYLSNTKAAFDKYIEIIGAMDGEDFTMDTSFSIMKNEKGESHPHEAFSRGQRDLYSLAARLALVDALYENEKPFIILDDPFAYFDDQNLARAMKAIKQISRQRQIIYLSCTKART